MPKGFFVVEGGRVTHRGSTAGASKELLVAARILANTFGCPVMTAEGKCPKWGRCEVQQMVHCVLVGLGKMAENRVCRVCGCTDDMGCEGGCSWVEEDLCSNCLDQVVEIDLDGAIEDPRRQRGGQMSIEGELRKLKEQGVELSVVGDADVGDDS